MLLYENTPDEIRRNDPADLARRLYYVTGISLDPQRGSVNGRIKMKHHQEARNGSLLKVKQGEFKNTDDILPVRSMSHLQFKALIEGQDFRITPLGDIVWMQ